jgi:hypothetical protein
LKELTVEVKIGTSAESISSYTIFGISPVFEESRRGVTLVFLGLKRSESGSPLKRNT